MEEKYVFDIGGMTCNSCERMISKSVGHVPGVSIESISAASGKMAVSAEESALGEIAKAIESAGYKALGNKKAGGDGNASDADESASDGQGSGCCNTSELKANHVLENLMSSKPEWKAERQLLLYAFATMTGLLLLLGLAYVGLWRGDAKFASTTLPLLAIGAVSIVAIVGAGAHFDAFHKPITCSTGMMEGMTFGMMSGFLVGALLGATNGMFWGSLLASIIGCVAGWWGGRTSGVMGVMEGLMAGIMSGTMGAMLSVMLVAEPLPIFLAFLTLVCVIILMALSYMNVKEIGLIGTTAKIPAFTSMASTCLIFFILLSAIMIYGPKSGLVFGGI